MPVERFRSIEEMNSAPLQAPAGQGFERFVRHNMRWWAMVRRSYPRGVFKFRSVEQAQAARELVTAENLKSWRSRPPDQ